MALVGSRREAARETSPKLLGGGGRGRVRGRGEGASRGAQQSRGRAGETRQRGEEGELAFGSHVVRAQVGASGRKARAKAGGAQGASA